MIRTTPTPRGFLKGKFQDRYGLDCSIQESSAADESCIWLGVDDARPEIMASDAQRMGMDTKGQFTGWVSFPIPPEVLIHSRMHLNRKQARSLVQTLNHWLKHDRLPKEQVKKAPKQKV